MKILKKDKKTNDIRTWEEESGLLGFLASVPSEVEKFNRSFEFGIEHISTLPSDIDGDPELPRCVGFILERRNPLLPELKYCVYSLLKGRVLYGYIGMYQNGSIQTLKELKPVSDFTKGKAVLVDWLRQLVRASCEKIML